MQDLTLLCYSVTLLCYSALSVLPALLHLHDKTLCVGEHQQRLKFDNFLG